MTVVLLFLELVIIQGKMFLKANYSDMVPTQYMNYIAHPNSSTVPCESNLSFRIIKDRVKIFDHPDVENPFRSRLTPLQDDILGGYMLIIGEL